jgi:hypothetical protein
LTISPAKINGIRKNQLKRLNNNNNSAKKPWGRYSNKTVTPSSSSSSGARVTRQQSFDYDFALNEYRALRNISQPNQQAAAVMPDPSTSSIVIDDDSDEGLEDGEIKDDDSPTKSVDKLMKESMVAVEHSRNFRKDGPSSSSSGKSNFQPAFYEDKNLERMKQSKTPLYHTRSFDKINGQQQLDASQDVICLDSTQSSSPDESILNLSENQSPMSVLSRPSFLSTPIINNLYNKIPVVKAPTNLNDQNHDNPQERKQRRTLRTRTYMAKKKLQRFMATPEIQQQALVSAVIQKPSMPAVAAVVAAPKQTTQRTIATPNPMPSTSYATVVSTPQSKEKRIILIDGSNMALGFSESKMGKLTNKGDKDFSAEGLKIAIDHFTNMGFQVKAIVPEYRVCRDKSSNATLMNKMKDAGELLLTPARAYDDLMLMQSALKLNAAIVSNDFFREYRNDRECHYLKLYHLFSLQATFE